MIDFALGGFIGAVLGMLLVAWRANDALRERGRQLVAARASCAEKDIEIERLDGLNVELRAEVVFLRGSSGGPEAAE